MKRILLALGFLAALAATAIAQVPPPIPALPDSERRTAYSISASTCACSVGFALYEDSTDVDQQISVWINGVQYLSTDPSHGWGLTSATGPLASIPRPITDAVLTFTAVQTGTVQIVGAQRPRRLSQFQTTPTTRDFNQVLTYLTSAEREQWDLRTRTLLGLPGENISPLPSAATRAGKFLFFDATGLIPQFTTGAPGSGNVVGPPSSTIGHLATWANTTGTLLADGAMTQLTINASGFTLPRSLVFGEQTAVTLSGLQDFATAGETILLFDTFGTNANGTIQFSKSGGGGQFTGGTAGVPSTTIAITATVSGSSANQQVVLVAGCPTGTTIVSGGGTGSWVVSNPCTLAGGTTILTNDNPQFPTPTLANQFLGFIVSSGWYNNGVANVPSNQSAVIRFTAPHNFTSSDWAGNIDFLLTPLGSTVNGGGGLGTPALTIAASTLVGGTLIETLNGLATTPADGLILQNKTAATAGVPVQFSPQLRLSATVWNTSGTPASNEVDWTVYAVPVSGSSPSSTLFFNSQINGGSFTSQARLTSGGVLSIATAYQIAGAVATAGNGLRSDGVNGFVSGQFGFGDLSGSVTCSQTPAFTGDISKSAGSCATAVANITTGATVPGFMDWTQTSAPANPASGHDRIFMSTVDTLKVLNSAGNITTTVAPLASVSHQFLTSLSNNGVLSQAQPAFTDISGSVACSQLPALTNDVTTVAGTCATTVANVTSGATFPGSYDWTLIAAPANPGAGKLRVFADNGGGANLKTLNSSGTVSTTVTPLSAASHQFLTAVSNFGVISQAQPAFTDISGTATRAQGASDMVLLNTLTASNSATLDDTTSLSASYDDYLILFENVVPVTNAVKLLARVTQNGGSTWLSTTYVDSSASTDGIYVANSNMDNTASYGTSGWMYINGINRTDNRKLTRGSVIFMQAAALLGGTVSGFYDGNNSAINGIRFLMSSGNISSGKIRIYGIKTS